MPEVEKPAPVEPTGFAALGLRPEILNVLTSLGYEEPTPIQRETIPRLLTGRDLLGQAATGTGKTAAFALPVLNDIESGRAAITTALVLVPTRELAMQVSEAVFKYGSELGVKTPHLRGAAHPAPAPGPPAWRACGGCDPRSGDRPHTARVTRSRHHPHRDSRRGRRDARHGLR